MKTPNSAPSMAASKSASAKKILGDLPPSSRVTRFTVSAACFTMILPTAALPVNAILLTSGCCTSGAPQDSPKPDDVDYARRQSAVGEMFGEFKRRKRSLFRGLQHAGAAGSDRRGEFPCRHQQRIVPRNDLSGNADWLFEREGHRVVGDRIHVADD